MLAQRTSCQTKHDGWNNHDMSVELINAQGPHSPDNNSVRENICYIRPPSLLLPYTDTLSYGVFLQLIGTTALKTSRMTVFLCSFFSLM